MKKPLYITLMLIISTLLTACQPTPSTAVVDSKQQQLVETTVITEPVEFPKELKKTIEKTKMVVNIDAEIKADTQQPVYVSELTQGSLTQEEIDSVVATLMQGKELYLLKTEYSKAEIETIILNLKAGKGSDGSGSDLFEVNPDAYYKEIESELKSYEAQYKTAPETIKMKKGSTKLEEVNGETILNLCTDLGKSKLAYFGYYDGYKQGFSFVNVDGVTPFGTVMNNIDIKSKISLSEAQSLAESVVDGLGMGEFVVSSVGSLPNPGIVDILEYGTYDKTPKCYVFYFTRSIHGLTETFFARETLWLYPQGLEQYNTVWNCETIQVAVDETGVITVDYTGPKAIITDKKTAVNLLPFDKIMDVFEKQIELQAPVNRYDDPAKITLNINRIVLGGTKIIKKDSLSTYLYVPTWDFFGTVTYQYDEGKGDLGQLNENREYSELMANQSFLTINAYDGSVINRAVGY